MGTQYKQVGGSGTGLGQDFSNILKQGINTGSFGGATAGSQAGAANPYGSTQGFFGSLNDILSGGAGKLGGSLGQLLATQQSNDVDAIRARFGAAGGTAFGTPGQYAESNYRAQAAPQIATQVGQLQMSALMPLLNLIGGFAGKDIAQAETAASENPWLTAAKLGVGAASTYAGFKAPSGVTSGGGGGGSGGGWLPPNHTPPIVPPFQVNPNWFNPTPSSSYGGWQPNWQVPTFNFAGR